MADFRKTHSDDEIQKIVAFARHLPHLTPGETELRKVDPTEDAEYHDHGEQRPDQVDRAH
jgi:hypothetical protein